MLILRYPFSLPLVFGITASTLFPLKTDTNFTLADNPSRTPPLSLLKHVRVPPHRRVTRRLFFWLAIFQLEN